MHRLARLFVPVTAALACGAAGAHHNTGAYFDTDTEFTIEGTVDEVQWRNPHVYFTITGTSDGETNTWRIEAGPTGIMRRLDWDKTTLQPGEAVTVVANPSRRENGRSGYLVSVAAPGKTYPPLRGEKAIEVLSVDEAEVAGTAADIAGTWTTLLDLEYVHKLYGDEPLPLTAKGLASKEAFDETTDAPALKCIPAPVPDMMTIPDIKLITVEDDRIRVRGEFYNTERIIYLDAAAAPTEPTLHGRSIGRWEDGTLVVESDLFSVHRQGITFDVESSPEKRVVERIRLNDDGKGLTYSFVLEDPEMLEEPFTGEFQYVYRPDIEYESLPCDLENSRQYLYD